MIDTRDPRHAARSLLLLLGAVASAAPALEAHEFGRFFDGLAAPLRTIQRERPAPQRLPPGCDDAVERLAAEIDWLGHHLDAYGSVVAKEPDVWGQSRLMRHRYEYEAWMQKQLGQFADRSQAAIRRSDQTFLSMVLALEQAADRRRSPDLAAAAAPHDFGHPPSDAAFAVQPPALEPTIHLDHLSRYLNHLHELRRINEGDDSADAPGYALNLIRVPVSILPGKHTHAGHGAEITFTADPCLGGELLPSTFRMLVINDLVDLIAPPLTCCVNDAECLAWAATIADGRNGGLPRQAEEAAMHSLSRRLPMLVPSTAPAVKTRRARMPIPFSQLADASGVRQMAILIRDTHAALARHPANRPCIEYADVRGLLAEELQAAADFLAQPRQRPLWEEMPAWNLAELVRSRRTDELSRIRCHVFASIGAGTERVAIDGHDEQAPGDGACCDERLSPTPVCRTTTAMLAWGILVESSLLNERLVDDMRESAVARHTVAEACAGPFYGPDPAPEARAAFDDYVRRRWPIRVFALDPVADEQNVEDAFARRREVQVALAMAFASGRISTATMSRYARKLETDMATIALNQTAVGFSHGADTFGWRFYPRVQTPPTRSGLAAFSETLCGPSADADLAQRKLEPGQRECTAIIVMPSFVPAMTIDVRSGWFSLTRPHDADRSMRQTMVLSRSVQAMRTGALACSRAAHLYRDGEVARLLRTVEQLDRRLPLQTLHAQIPSENTCGGFELFTAGVTDLAPELAGWYGAPGIDPDGTTTLFLVGKGFSVHDTTIVAGGKPVACTLVSREVLRAEIPAGVATLPAASPAAEPCADVALTAAVEPLPAPAFPPFPEAVACTPHACDRREMVDIHLATPYGVSSHLLVPVARRRAVARSGLAFDPGFGIGLTFTTSKAAGGRSESAKVDEFFSATADAIVITVPETFVPPPKATLRLLVRDAADGTTAAALSFDDLAFDVARRAYVIAGGDLRNFIGDTSRPATDKTLRGAVKPYLDNLLGRGELAADGDDVACTITAALVAEQREIAIGGSLAVTAVRRGKTVVEPQAAEPPRGD